MKVELFPFQKMALQDLRRKTAMALGNYLNTGTPQIVSFTAPTGAGKTVILSALIENIFWGDDDGFPDQQDAIFVWISDSPELNEQSKMKIDFIADRVGLNQCITISDETFDSEVLEDGHIYFLNTQKLSKSSRLTGHGDGRQYSIWETIQNTADQKSGRLYFIIDEAHRGMQGNKAAVATSIMQKFLKGSVEDGLRPIPVVIGVTATPQRFHALASGISSSMHYVYVTPDDVRASGLLKDRIVITYPEDNTSNKDMAILQAAADEWRDKWEHWAQYCYEQHYAYVNPIFVVQVLNNTGSGVTDTNLDDCISKIEKRTGFTFKAGEVVHTFGQTTATLTVNGLDVYYVEPSRIAEDRKIKVVFFKENLSTGWDCPRAETMMSFRHASDATYIAQLLGRMVRTPMQSHIQVDDSLNDVHLFLPYFNSETVQSVVDELQNSEGGALPTDIIQDPLGGGETQTWTIRPTEAKPVTIKTEKQKPHNDNPAQVTLTDVLNGDVSRAEENDISKGEKAFYDNFNGGSVSVSDNGAIKTETKTDDNGITTNTPIIEITDKNDEIKLYGFDREAVVNAINNAGLLTYNVRQVRVNKNYLSSLFCLVRLLSQSGVYRSARNDVVDEIVNMIFAYIDYLKKADIYEKKVEEVQQFKLKAQIFDVYGKKIEVNQDVDLFTTTDSDVDRQFRLAEARLCNEGVANKYLQKFAPEDYIQAKIEVILFVADERSIGNLNKFAENEFHQLNDQYRRNIAQIGEKYRKKYDSIVSDGDIISKHNFCIPEAVVMRADDDGDVYKDHLFVDGKTGQAVIKLNGWEKKALDAERKRPDFVCWLRNPVRKPWSLCIPYTLNHETKAMYPDFIVIRSDCGSGYIVDVLEPHDQTRIDNLGKAQGLAEYSEQNPGIGRIQLIRIGNDGLINRLDMSKTVVRDRVKHATSNEELNHIFDEYGITH